MSVCGRGGTSLMLTSRDRAPLWDVSGMLGRTKCFARVAYHIFRNLASFLLLLLTLRLLVFATWMLAHGSG